MGFGGRLVFGEEIARVAAQGFGEAQHPIDGEAPFAFFEFVDLAFCRAAGFRELLEAPAAEATPVADSVGGGFHEARDSMRGGKKKYKMGTKSSTNVSGMDTRKG